MLNNLTANNTFTTFVQTAQAMGAFSTYAMVAFTNRPVFGSIGADHA